MASSEVAQIRQQIETECQALANLMQYAAVASHQSISARYHKLEKCRTQLESLIGEEQATALMIESYNQHLH